MSERLTRIRIFSVRRILYSAVLGLFVPLTYALTLSLAADYSGRSIPNFMVYPFGWPRPLWIYLMGHQPSEDDLIFGIVFIALCNIALYGALSYMALTALHLLRHKPVEPTLPPPPSERQF
jgi:hypothetical protein